MFWAAEPVLLRTVLPGGFGDRGVESRFEGSHFANLVFGPGNHAIVVGGDSGRLSGC